MYPAITWCNIETGPPRAAVLWGGSSDACIQTTYISKGGTANYTVRPVESYGRAQAVCNHLSPPKTPVVITMTSKIDLGEADVALIEKCGSFQQVRNFENNLYVQSKTGSEFVVPRIQYSPLIGEQPRVRLLRLHPTNNISENVHCDLEIHDFSQMPPFIAVQNARGYRKIEEAIEVVHGGVRRALIISAALERFLRYLRTRVKEPTHVWVRYACVLEFHLLEQQTYWTREFRNKMYAAASKIFDMHEINSRLIENGYFERCLDSRYAEWKKEWYGRPDETVLPRVCPVRLGTRPENDSPTMRYRYMPLDMVADEIRIVCVMPADDDATPIVMHVAHCPMKCEVNYIALSCMSRMLHRRPDLY